MRKYFIDKAAEIDPREEKLPAWVREKISTLRRATSEAVHELIAFKEGSEPGPFWIENFDDVVRFYLPKSGGRLMYGDPAGGGELMLTADRPQSMQGWLEVTGHGTDSVVARPWAANVMLLKGQDR